VFKIVRTCARSVPTSAQMAAPLADRGINDRLVELRPLVDETRFEFIDVSNFGAINFWQFWTQVLKELIILLN